MKGIDIFCASQASTAICLSMDQATSSCISSNAIQLGSRAIDRHNPIITDSSRFASTDPRKSSSSNPEDQNKTSSTKGGHHHQKKKSSAGKPSEKVNDNYSSNPINSILPRSWVRPPPAGSSRYLLSDAAFLDNLSSEYDSVLALPSSDNQNAQVGHRDDAETKPDSKSSVSADQVVVLRVSLHCKGCEGKVRKHLSRMEGVSSFNIDFAAKKVTIVGDVTPLSVLQSVSKVKNAQFWPGPASAVGSGIAETKKTSLI